MKYLFILLITPILLLGCAKEEDSTTSTSPDSSSGSMSFSGKVAQGYVEGAKVFADLDGDGVRDSNESQGTTDASGSYTLKADPGS